jgi:hypothetical protein
MFSETGNQDQPSAQVLLDHSPARTITGSTTGNLTFRRLALRSLALQPGNSLIGLALTLSVGFSMSIAIYAAIQARRLLALTAAGLPSE